MSSEDLGIELAKEIYSTVVASAEDICENFGVPLEDVFLEYITLLLWVGAKEIQNWLPKERIQETIDVMASTTLAILTKEVIGRNDPGFTPKSFGSFVHNRFELYYSAWRALQVDDDNINEITVVHNFVLYCVTDSDGDMAAFQRRDHKEHAEHMGAILEPYRAFTKKAKALVSRL